MIMVDREEELKMFNDVDGVGLLFLFVVMFVVVVEGLGEDKWVIKVEVNYCIWLLIQLLNVLLELEFGVFIVDYGSMNGWFYVNICVKVCFVYLLLMNQF